MWNGGGISLAQTSLLTCCPPSRQVVVEQSQAEALAAAAAAGDSLICQAIINSGIALGTEEAVVEETSQETEEINKVVTDCPDADENITEIQVKEEFVEMEAEVKTRVTAFYLKTRFAMCCPFKIVDCITLNVLNTVCNVAFSYISSKIIVMMVFLSVIYMIIN